MTHTSYLLLLLLLVVVVVVVVALVVVVASMAADRVEPQVSCQASLTHKGAIWKNCILK